MEIKIKKLHPDAKLPSYAHPGDVGMDLFSLENFLLKPGQRHKFCLGFALEIPENFAPQIWPKSGLSINHGLHTLGGVIDCGYRGEYTAILINLSNEEYEIKKGDKIAQLLIQPIAIAKLKEVEELSETKRADGAFGSTGKN